MGKPHPIELRERVVLYVDEGHSHQETARVFTVSVSFVNNMIKLRRKTGSLAAKKQGNPGKGKLSPYNNWVKERLAEKGDLTLDELSLELLEQHGVRVHRASVGYWLHRLGLSSKKNSYSTRTNAS
jgi:transposase